MWSMRTLLIEEDYASDMMTENECNFREFRTIKQKYLKLWSPKSSIFGV